MHWQCLNPRQTHQVGDDIVVSLHMSAYSDHLMRNNSVNNNKDFAVFFEHLQASYFEWLQFDGYCRGQNCSMLKG